MLKAKKDLTGLKVGSLQILERGRPTFTHKGGELINWAFKCDCGRTGQINSRLVKPNLDLPKTCGEYCLLKKKNKLAIMSTESLAFT